MISKACYLLPRSHALRGNAYRDALRYSSLVDCSESYIFKGMTLVRHDMHFLDATQLGSVIEINYLRLYTSSNFIRYVLSSFN